MLSGCPSSVMTPGKGTSRKRPRKSPCSHFENISNEGENRRREKRRKEGKERRKAERHGGNDGGKRKECFHVFPVTKVSTSGKSVSHENVLAIELFYALRSILPALCFTLVCILALWKCHQEILSRERILTGSHFGSFLSKTLSQ